jgi:hypothetical protein
VSAPDREAVKSHDRGNFIQGDRIIQINKLPMTNNPEGK